MLRDIVTRTFRPAPGPTIAFYAAATITLVVGCPGVGEEIWRLPTAVNLLLPMLGCS